MTDIDKQRDHFNSVATRYYEARSHPNHLRYKELVWNLVFESMRFEKNEALDVLEPMCGFAEGHAILVTHLGKDSIRYEGFDYSDVVVDSLLERLPQLSVEVADVTTYSTHKKFDTIILIGGLHHVPNHARTVVSTLAQTLKPGGYFLNLEPTHGNSVFRMVRDFIYKRNTLFDETTERAFSVDELLGFFESAGLTSRLSLFPGLLGYVMYYNPDAFPYFNLGNVKVVDTLFRLEKSLFTTTFARWFSFATLTVWRKGVELQ